MLCVNYIHDDDDQDLETGPNVENDEEEGPQLQSPEKTEKLFKFPLGTIKRLMKLDPDVNMTNQVGTKQAK